MIKPERTQKVLDTFAKKVIKDARSILRNKKNTGNLSDSLKYRLKVYDSGALDLNFEALDYFDFVDKGVQGNSGQAHPKRGKLAPDSPYKYGNKMPPTKILDKWVVKKGLKAARDEKGKFIKRKSLVFAIAKSIQLYGLEATQFFTSPFNKHYKKLPQDVINAYAKDVSKFLKFATKDL
ncbi:MAG: hypothetical protein Unbinned92contig1003_13 [Prokaryotic dsDNA virus sp.]|nr:MAG: hypothetical protein Unbinned92contig1003_13 [Prokaryotic dsDNA virus sp.]|tara:strand:+ start:7306 stop:7842 length:537 start_codon:yes stop_codon:yes gene_type:complete